MVERLRSVHAVFRAGAATMLEHYLQMFVNLRTDKCRDRYPAMTYHRAPHKPFLLLSIMDLVGTYNNMTSSNSAPLLHRDTFLIYCHSRAADRGGVLNCTLGSGSGIRSFFLTFEDMKTLMAEIHSRRAEKQLPFKMHLGYYQGDGNVPVHCLF
jgi:hypothetical protein